MDNNLFIKNILILIFCIILIHLFLNDYFNLSQYWKGKNDNDDNFTNTNKTKVYLFYADWCGHCQDYKPTFNDFKKKVQNNKNITVFEINADDPNPNNKILSNKYNIESFTTTIIDINGKITK